MTNYNIQYSVVQLHGWICSLTCLVVSGFVVLSLCGISAVGNMLVSVCQLSTRLKKKENSRRCLAPILEIILEQGTLLTSLTCVFCSRLLTQKCEQDFFLFVILPVVIYAFWWAYCYPTSTRASFKNVYWTHGLFIRDVGVESFFLLTLAVCLCLPLKCRLPMLRFIKKD